MTLQSAHDAPAADVHLSVPVRVVTAAQIMTPKAWPPGTRIVVDATGVDLPSLPLLARMVHVRRELRAVGGDVVLAAHPETAALLRSSGLHCTVPYRGDVATAVAALDPVGAASGWQ